MKRYLCLCLIALSCSAWGAEAWHHPLYISGGGLWRQRVALDVRNDTETAYAGEQATVRVGTAPGEAALAGTRAEALRVCNSAGTEMLYALTSPTQETVNSGAILAGSILTIPVECPPHQTARYYVYFDNAQAWQVPDFLATLTGLRNGSLESGSGNDASAWNHDANDEQHRTFWTTEAPHSGQHCLKTLVAEGAEPTWIATRQTGLRITGGAKYVFTAWVKAQNVKGACGWYLHIGNGSNSMLISPMALAGEGTFDWKQVRAEFTAPADANRADLGTVLRGTGTAWFDDATLETPEGARLTAVASAPERITLAEQGESPTCGSVAWDYRLPVRVANTRSEARKTVVAVDVSGLAARLQGRTSTNALTVVFKGQVVPSTRLQNQLLFEAQLPAQSLSTYYVCAGGAATATADLKAEYQTLLASPRNLIKNGDFEVGEKTPADWAGGAEGERPAETVMGLDEPGLFGRRCAKIEIPATSKKAWTGWRQEVPVQPGRTYLYSAWVKCANLDGGLQLHVHLLNAQHELCKTGAYTGAGPAITGTTGWTLISGTFTMPADCAYFQAHLTMLATGTAWHDGAILTEIAEGEAGSLEGHSPAKLTVWPVNSVVKVFHEDVPPPQVSPARVTAAGDEYEPLQLAVRSPQTLGSVRVVVDPPSNAAGKKLPVPEIGVVGYVPIDHASNYYSSDTPEYYRKIPTGAAGCDGFPGMWPDPILPHDTFDLPANQTQALWITFYAPREAIKGDYKGTVRLVTGNQTIQQVPYTVHVWGFALPEQHHLKAIYDTRQSSAIWQVPGKDAVQVRRDFWKFMADRRVNPDRVEPDPVLSYQNGQVKADFTEYDKACDYYFNVLKFQHTYTPNVFYCFGWGFPPSAKFGEQPYEGTYPFEGVDRGKLRPEYKRAYQACLKAYWDHMKEKGWADRITLYISDEPHNDLPGVIAQMKALCDMIHEVDPTIPIYTSNWTPQPAWDNSITVWGAGQFGDFPVEKMKELQSEGSTIWFTVDGQMCTDTPYCACERLLPHYAFKYGVKAYEFWGIDWLTYDPYQFGWHSYISQSDQPGRTTWVRYPNGDGFLAYPGRPIGHDGAVTSVRLEQAREGLEDYEYLYLLQQAQKAGHGTPAMAAALAQASGLVEIPNAGGKYSTQILPHPDDVLTLKEKMGQALEGSAK